jgi:hypothetical protein
MRRHLTRQLEPQIKATLWLDTRKQICLDGHLRQVPVHGGSCTAQPGVAGWVSGQDQLQYTPPHCGGLPVQQSFGGVPCLPFQLIGVMIRPAGVPKIMRKHCNNQHGTLIN